MNEMQHYPVLGMTCAGCAAGVESALKGTPGVAAATVNLAQNSVAVSFSAEVSDEALQRAVQNAGFDLIIAQEDPLAAQEEAQKEAYEALTKRLWAMTALTLPIFIIGMFFMQWEAGKWVSMLLSMPLLFVLGKNYYVSAWKNAMLGKANMDTLIALSTSIAFVFSAWNTLWPAFWSSRGITPHVYYEAAAVIVTVITLGKWLEERAKSSTASAIKELLHLQPKEVRVLLNGQEKVIPLAHVQPGYTVLINPNEAIPVDGEIIEGSSSIVESAITGESMPAEKSEGDTVYAGTVNAQGQFKMVAKAVGGETVLAQIVGSVQKALSSKAPVQLLVDKISAIFVPTIIVLSVLTFAAWAWFGGEEAFTHGLLTAISVLVIACPCALGLATPTAIMVGVGKGAQHNILIKDAQSLESAKKVNTVVLDKTGTLTKGTPEVHEVAWIDGVESRAVHGPWIKGLEAQSEHPLAKAVAAHLSNVQPEEVLQVESVTGLGIKALGFDGELLVVGSAKFVQAHIKLPIPPHILEQYEASSVVLAGKGDHLVAAFYLHDAVVESAEESIAALASKGVEVHLLSGDVEGVVQKVAGELDIRHYKGGVLPSEKLAYIQDLQQRGRVVAMVGDGVNDAPAMACADLSIAMGKGSDIAINVAQMTLVTTDLNRIPMALRLAKQTVQSVRENLFWAFIYNILGIPIAAGVLYPVNGFLLDPMIAGSAMAFSSVSVVLNSLRLRYKRL